MMMIQMFFVDSRVRYQIYNPGVIDWDKFSRAALINKNLVRVNGRKMRPSEKFILTFWVPWRGKEVAIVSDRDLNV